MALKVISVKGRSEIRLPDNLVDPLSRTVVAMLIQNQDGTKYIELLNPAEWQERANVLLQGVQTLFIYLSYPVKDFFRSSYDLNVGWNKGAYRVYIPKYLRGQIPQGRTVLV